MLGQKKVLERSSSIDKIDAEFNLIYQNQFVNFDQEDTRFEYLVDQGNMLVICYDGFMDEMEPFIEWKNRKGIPTEMVSVSSIGSSSSSIENYVSNKVATILLASHNMNEVERLCNEVMMMKDGEIIDKGKCDDLINKHGRKNLEEVVLKLVRE